MRHQRHNHPSILRSEAIKQAKPKPAKPTEELDSAAYAKRYLSSTATVLALTASKILEGLMRLHDTGVLHAALTPWSFDFTTHGISFNDMSFAHSIDGDPLSFEHGERYPNYVP